MAVTKTRTQTKTFTRISLMKLQVDRILTRSRVGQSTIEKILDGIDRKWIAEVSLYGLDDDGKCWSEMYVKIDWDRNRIHVSAGRDSVAIDDRWRDDVAIEVEKVMELFEEYAEAQDLRIKCHTRYASGVDRDKANEVLGMKSVSKVKWAGGSEGSAMTVPEIDEFTVGIKLV